MMDVDLQIPMVVWPLRFQGPPGSNGRGDCPWEFETPAAPGWVHPNFKSLGTKCPAVPDSWISENMDRFVRLFVGSRNWTSQKWWYQKILKSLCARRYLDVSFEAWREKSATCGNQFTKLAEKEKWQKLARKIKYFGVAICMGHQSIVSTAQLAISTFSKWHCRRPPSIHPHLVWTQPPAPVGYGWNGMHF